MVTDALLDAIFDELFPICRSITGDGLRQSLRIMQRYLPLEIETVRSGTQVFDWTVPPEWNIRGGRLTGPRGEVLADFEKSNLCIVNYSEPVNCRLTLAQLRPHLHSVPGMPHAVPYVTSYYKRTWGFCLADRTVNALEEGEYHAQIDSSLTMDGGVTFGHCILPGESDAEILLSSYFCHPSLANNELSGPLVLLGLYDRLSRWPRRRFTYRFLLNPETIGALCFLHVHGQALRERLAGGLVLTCLGGPAPTLSYKTSRQAEGLLDRTVRFLKEHQDEPLEIRPFDPRGGSDERQYCSPGFNLPVGQFARTVYGRYPGYHNSDDTKEFMGIGPLVRSIEQIERVLRHVEIGGPFLNLKPYGEPQLGTRGLYPNVNSASNWNKSTDVLADSRQFLNRALMILSYSDGEHDMAEIAVKCECPLHELAPIIEKLEEAELLQHRGRRISKL
jgi:aminopeptidase-like protein